MITDYIYTFLFVIAMLILLFCLSIGNYELQTQDKVSNITMFIIAICFIIMIVSSCKLDDLEKKEKIRQQRYEQSIKQSNIDKIRAQRPKLVKSFELISVETKCNVVPITNATSEGSIDGFSIFSLGSIEGKLHNNQKTNINTTCFAQIIVKEGDSISILIKSLDNVKIIQSNKEQANVVLVYENFPLIKEVIELYTNKYSVKPNNGG